MPKYRKGKGYARWYWRSTRRSVILTRRRFIEATRNGRFPAQCLKGPDLIRAGKLRRVEGPDGVSIVLRTFSQSELAAAFGFKDRRNIVKWVARGSIAPGPFIGARNVGFWRYEGVKRACGILSMRRQARFYVSARDAEFWERMNNALQTT